MQKVLQKTSGDPAPDGMQPIRYTNPKHTQTDSSLVAIVAYGEWPGQDLIQGFRASGNPAPDAKTFICLIVLRSILV